MEFPSEVYDYVQKNGLVESIVRYIIDRRFRTSVYLKTWLADQVKNPSEELVAAADSIPSSNDNDTQITLILKWVNQHIQYKTDKSVWDVLEKWQPANETLKLKTGDCEDGAILMYVLARLKNIPANRLLLMAGDVKGGGHCWLAYKWQPTVLTFMDWCYWYDRNQPRLRNRYYLAGTTIKSPSDTNYQKMWFGFNEDGTYLRFVPTVNK